MSIQSFGEDNWRKAIDDVLNCFVLNQDERDGVVGSFESEFDRRFPQILKRELIVAMLPSIRRSAEGFFRSNRVPFPDAEDLGGKVVVKILTRLSRGAPNGNPGAFVSKLRERVLIDYWRRKRRGRMRGESCDA